MAALGTPGSAALRSLGVPPPSPRTVESPAVSRLDRVLDLVTEHEAQYREQALRVQEVARRLADCEERVERELQPFREVDVRGELEQAKLAVDRLHRQVVLLNQDSEASHQAAHGGIDAVSARQAALEKRLEDLAHAVQVKAREAAEATAEARAGFKRLVTEVVERVSCELDALRAHAAAEHARRQEETQQLQAWARTEIAALQARVGEQDAKFASAEQGLQRQAGEQQRQLEVALGRMDVIATERERLRKRLAKAQAAEALDGAGGGGEQLGSVQQTLERLREETANLRTQYHSLEARYETTSSETANMSAQLDENQRVMDRVEHAVQQRGRDLAHLAETVGGALKATAGLPRGGSSAWGPTPLGAPGLSAYGYGAPPGGVAPAQPPGGELAQFDAFLSKLKTRIRDTHRDVAREKERGRREREQRKRRDGARPAGGSAGSAGSGS